MTTINIHQAKTQLSALIKKVLEGEKVIIAKNNVPVVELKPIEKKNGRRGFGALKGKYNFDEKKWNELDKEIEDLFYNSDIEP